MNSQAPDYADFPRLIQPYLVRFGVPYVVRDIARQPIGNDLGSCALLIIGHRGLDAPHWLLRSDDEARLLAAVQYNPGTQEGMIELVGSSDLPSKFYVFESSDRQLGPREWEGPVFKGKAIVRWRARSDAASK